MNLFDCQMHIQLYKIKPWTKTEQPKFTFQKGRFLNLNLLNYLTTYESFHHSLPNYEAFKTSPRVLTFIVRIPNRKTYAKLGLTQLFSLLNWDIHPILIIPKTGYIKTKYQTHEFSYFFCPSHHTHIIHRTGFRTFTLSYQKAIFIQHLYF